MSYSSIVSYNLYMREYNSGNPFQLVYSGNNFEYDVTNGITQLIQYEFKISDIDSENRESDFSNSAIFYATSVTLLFQILI